MRLREKLVAAVLGGVSFAAGAQAQEANVRYSWMLPKTVLETTVSYTFVECTDGDKSANLKLKIVPTIVAKAVPDTYVGRLAIRPTEQLQSFWEDRNVNIKTFAGSHILSSIGSSPASQAGQITTNVLTGVSKIVAVALGVGVVAFTVEGGGVATPAPAPNRSKCGAAQGMKQKIDALKAEIIQLQESLANGIEEAVSKKAKVQIEAKQALVAAKQVELDDMSTVVIKRTIDPGFAPVAVDPDGQEPDLLSKKPPGPIDANGLVATFKPNARLLKKAGWYEDNAKISATESEMLEINVYMNMDQAVRPVRKKEGKWVHTPVSENDGEIFRDVAYIPVVVWRGRKLAPPAVVVPPEVAAAAGIGGPLAPVQLTSTQMIAFGQFGTPQVLPFEANAFKSLGWAMTFQENGEVTEAQFSNKAWGVGATGAFASGAGAANSIATELRNSSSASLEATALQGQADLIFQRQRLQKCESDPATCTK